MIAMASATTEPVAAYGPRETAEMVLCSGVRIVSRQEDNRRSLEASAEESSDCILGSRALSEIGRSERGSDHAATTPGAARARVAKKPPRLGACGALWPGVGYHKWRPTNARSAGSGRRPVVRAEGSAVASGKFDLAGPTWRVDLPARQTPLRAALPTNSASSDLS